MDPFFIFSREELERLQGASRIERGSKLYTFIYPIYVDTVDGRNPANQLRWLVYLLVYKVLDIPSGTPSCSCAPIASASGVGERVLGAQTPSHTMFGALRYGKFEGVFCPKTLVHEVWVSYNDEKTKVAKETWKWFTPQSPIWTKKVSCFFWFKMFFCTRRAAKQRGLGLGLGLVNVSDVQECHFPLLPVPFFYFG